MKWKKGGTNREKKREKNSIAQNPNGPITFCSAEHLRLETRN